MNHNDHFGENTDELNDPLIVYEITMQQIINKLQLLFLNATWCV